MEQMTQAEYLRLEPNRCPFCFTSGNVEYEEVELGSPETTQEVYCQTCDSVWYDVYLITRYEPIRIGPEAARIRQKREETTSVSTVSEVGR